MLAGCERALAEVDLEAIRHNVRRLSRGLAGGAAHCAVVKANGYGHGAVPAARAALEAGSAWLGVASVGEAEELRDAGLTARVLIFGPLTGAELARAVAADADVVVWSQGFFEQALRVRARVRRPAEVAARVDRVIARSRAIDADVALFAHGHVLRVLAARWIGLPALGGQHFRTAYRDVERSWLLPRDTRCEDLECASPRPTPLTFHFSATTRGPRTPLRQSRAKKRLTGRVIGGKHFTACHGRGSARLRRPYSAALVWLRICCDHASCGLWCPHPPAILPALQDRVEEIGKLVGRPYAEVGYRTPGKPVKDLLDLVGTQSRANPIQKDELRRYK